MDSSASSASFEGHTPHAVLPYENTSTQSGPLHDERTYEALRSRPRKLVIPDQRSTPVQLDQSISRDDTATPSHNAFDLESPLHTTKSTSAAIRARSTPLLASPSRAANVRVKRSNTGQALLQSPPRAGYTSRMRQIFEDASYGQSELQSDSPQLYPQLPNVSRTAAPVATRSPGAASLDPRNRTYVSQKYRPESLCLSTELLSVVTPTSKTVTGCQRVSPSSPGSWSDDSGYIITETRDHSRSSANTLQQMIHGWLDGLADEGCGTFMSSDSEDEQVDSVVVEQRSEIYDVFRTRSQTLSMESSSELEARSHAKLSMTGPSSALDDPFAINANRCGGLVTSFMAGRGHHDKMPESIIASKALQKCATSLQASTGGCAHDSELHASEDEAVEAASGEIQLSPLSPNVCIERGPSRYRSNRKLSDDSFTTPSREGPPTWLRSPRLKENVGMRVTKSGNDSSPLAPRSSRFVTRFHPQQ